MNTDITLNSLEHFCFCKYQWWLNYTQGEWLQNVHTVLGDIVHTKVDDPHFVEKRKGITTKRSVVVYNDSLALYGIADLLEFINGDVPRINVVEYKKGKPQDNGEAQVYDGLQVYAQMRCLQSIYDCNIDGYIYYNSIRRRVKLKNLDFYENLLLDTLDEMRQYLTSGNIPPKNITKSCRACSMYEICLPYLDRRRDA